MQMQPNVHLGRLGVLLLERTGFLARAFADALVIKLIRRGCRITYVQYTRLTAAVGFASG